MRRGLMNVTLALDTSVVSDVPDCWNEEICN